MKNLQNINLKKQEQHPFHLVDPSPWPLFTSISLWSVALGFIMYFHYFAGGAFQLILSIVILTATVSRWFWDITVEATFEGHHTFKVQQNILFGMMLFICSEVMFFFAFFWGFFHFSLAPSVAISGIWPPAKGINVLDFGAVPLLNTVLLLSSGVTVTWAHRGIVAGSREDTTYGIICTVIYGAIFTLFQKYEYDHATFSINDGVYGSVFYMTTGFHGLHVLIGTIFLIVCLVRHNNYHFFKTHHVGFVCAIWYWHFVDVVWIFLYLCVYIWGA